MKTTKRHLIILTALLFGCFSAALGQERVDWDGETASGTFTISSNVYLKKTITVTGTLTLKLASGATEGYSILCGASNKYHFVVKDGGTLKITGKSGCYITIGGGAAYSGQNAVTGSEPAGYETKRLVIVQSSGGNIDFDYVILQNCYSGSAEGAAINFGGEGSLDFDHGKIRGCKSDGTNGGAAIAFEDGAKCTAILNDVEIFGCYATSSSGSTCGGIIRTISGSKVNLTLNNCVMHGNKSNGDGGVVYWNSRYDGTYGTLTVIGNSKFYSNVAAKGGGAMMIKSRAIIETAEIYDNTAKFGGGIAGTPYGANSWTDPNPPTSITIGSSTDASKVVTIRNNTATGTSAAESGGGVYFEVCDKTQVTSGTFALNIYNAQIYENKAAKGGGISIYDHTTTNFTRTFNIKGCKIYDNNKTATIASTYQGGGIYVYKSANNRTLPVNIENSQIYTNKAYDGAGVYVEETTGNANSKCELYVKGTSIIRNNTSSRYGGGIYVNSNGKLFLTGANIYSNTATTDGGGIYKLGQLTVSGTITVNNNTQGSSPIASNVFIPSTAGEKYVNIDLTNGLSCSSKIGVTKTHSFTQNSDGENYTQIASGNVNHCADAFANHFFFDDRNNYSVYNYASGQLNFVETWKTNANVSGISVSGTTATVNTAAGLAYIAKLVNAGTNTYTTINLGADLDLSGHYWEPIGEQYTACSSPTNHSFTGTFNGNAHVIKNVKSSLSTANMGLFGNVGSGGTIKNLMINSGSVTATGATNHGGIVGELNGGTVYNCMVTGTFSGGTNIGALVGKITSGTVKNSFAISNNAAAGSGTVTNCYVRKASGGTSSNMGKATNVGSSGNTTGDFTETVTPYKYRHADNKVSSTALLTLLNQWVDAQSSPSDLAHWTRTCASPINGDYPLLKFSGMKCVGNKSGATDALAYNSSLNTMLGTHNASGDNIFFWGSESGVTAGNSNAKVYFDEDAAIIHTSVIDNAYVGVTLKNAAWHMFSPAISSAPLGINYNNDATVYPYLTPPTQYAFYPESTYDGYFPSTDFGGNAYYSDYDYYCYYEPEYHWINFKRNTPSHWHEDLDHPNIEYHWDNHPENSSSLGNETTLKPGKGYLLGIKTDTYLQSHGTLNPSNGSGDVTFPVSRKSGWRIGYNLIGNPYQAYLDFNAFASANSGSGKIWSNASSAFYLMIYGGAYHQYVYNASSNQLGAPRCLHPHQGFMVITENDNVNATFSNSMRVLGNAPFRDDNHVDYPLVNLVVTDDEDKSDIATIELGRPDTGGAPKKYDLHTGKGCLYVNYDDEDYAIAFTQPGVNEVAVRFNADEEAAFTMTWDMENGDFSYVHLIDNMTGADIDCLQDREYCFTARPSDYRSRFRLVLDYTGIEENEDYETDDALTTFAFQMNDELVVNGEGQLLMFDLTGRQVFSANTYGTQSRVMLPNIGAGMYVLRMNGKNGIKTQKIVIR